MALRVPVPQRVTVIRIVALSVSLTAAIGAFGLFLQVAATTGLDWLDGVRAGLILIATFWLAWGAVLALLGLCCSQARRPILTAPVRGRTVILVPIYNEDPVVTFARIAAMTGELRDHALTASVHIAILSDTTDKVIAARERFWFLRLLTETDGNGWIFYRRRGGNRGRKAGNVADFIRRSGAAYDYALILDADSLMTGNTIVQMIRRMDADPRLGLLQSPPTIIRARSRFGRAMQFSAAFHGPIYGRGLAMMQGQTGPFWGHNAIVRISAFANSCGLPELSGPAPFGGHVLSHDYVEAALLARAGWTVRLDTDLEGSFEEAPDNMIAFAKRDRRWCQGNLQHARILPASGLRLWSRFVFVQGILAYLAPVFWVVFLLASIAAPILTPAITAEPDYFPQANWPFPVLPADQASQAIGRALGVFGLLIVPKLAIALDAGQGFGGAGVWRGRAGVCVNPWRTDPVGHHRPHFPDVPDSRRAAGSVRPGRRLARAKPGRRADDHHRRVGRKLLDRRDRIDRDGAGTAFVARPVAMAGPRDGADAVGPGGHLGHIPPGAGPPVPDSVRNDPTPRDAAAGPDHGALAGVGERHA